MTGMGAEQLWGALRTDGAIGSVRFEREVATSPEDLWAAVTEPGRLARWFCPVAGELIEGGRYRADLGADGVVRGRILACDPGRGYTVTWEDGGTQESEIEVAVRAAEDGAVLVLEHRALPSRYLADYGAGWQAFLEQLRVDRAGAGDSLAPGRVEALLPAYREVAAAVGVPAWAHDIDGVLRRREGLPAVRFDRHYATTAEDLWSAITEPDRLARWLMPITGDLRAGGSYTVDYGEQGTATGRILECDPGRAFSITWQIAGEEAGVVSVQIVTGDHDPLLRLDHVRLPEEYGVGYAAGWHAYLDRLGAELGEDRSAGEVDFSDRWAEVVPNYRSIGAVVLR